MIPSNKEFDNTVNNILQSYKYKHLKNDLLDFIQKIKEKASLLIHKIINKIISNIEKSQSVSDNLANVFIIIGILMIFIIVILIIVKVSKSFQRKSRIKEILGERINDKTTPSSLRCEAASFRDKGDYRRAIRYDFIAILLLMHEKNTIYLDETKTNGEIHKYLKQNKFPMMLELENIILHFNSSWYGDKQCDRATYDVVFSNVNLLWSEVVAYEEKK